MRISAVFVICFVSLFAGAACSYCEDSSSSDILVFGSSSGSTSGTETSGSSSSSSESGDSGTAAPTVAPFYEISGSRIGSTKASQEVTLPSEGEIMFVDAGIARSFSIIRVGKDGSETQVLSMSPERALGHKLAKGTYKVYPEDVDGDFPRDKLTVKVQVKVAGNETGETQ